MLGLNDATAVLPPTSQKQNEVSKNPPSRSLFLSDLIAKANSTFVTGYVANSLFKEKIKQDEVLQKKIRPNPQKFPQFHDAHFTWDANRIAGTSYVAAAGPKSTDDVGLLIQNTAYNTHTPIRHIIALGSCLAYDPFNHQDFHDYCIKERTIAFGAYETTIKKVSGKSQSTLSEHQIFPSELIQSTLSIAPPQGQSDLSNQQLSVTTIPLDDNYPILLSDEGQYEEDDPPSMPIEKYLEYLKETLWQLFEKSLHETILIHCASGVGRTGHLILTFEILKHYDQVFASNNPDVVAENIHAILLRLRKNRPALVATKIQFEKAIRNAVALHEYALKKGYIQTNTLFSKALFSEPEVKQDAPVLEKSELALTTNSSTSLLDPKPHESSDVSQALLPAEATRTSEVVAGLATLGVFGVKNPDTPLENSNFCPGSGGIQVNTI